MYDLLNDDSRGTAMPIIHFELHDTLEMRKPHPCGSRLFSVDRLGSEVKITCKGCGRSLTQDRIRLERSIRHVIPASNESDRLTDGDKQDA